MYCSSDHVLGGQEFVYTNMGFVFVRNNQRTKSFYKELHNRMTLAVENGTFVEEQHILRELLKSTPPFCVMIVYFTFARFAVNCICLRS